MQHKLRFLALSASILALTACTGGGGGSSGGGGGGGLQPPQAINYGSLDFSFQPCGEVTPAMPQTSGGDPTTWSIEPALPSGLTFSVLTGEISGTPDVVTADATYMVTASNPAGSTSVQIQLEVALEVPSFNYPLLPDELGQGVRTKFTPVFQSGRGSSFALTAGELPVGVTLDSATGEIEGVPIALETVAFEITSTDCAGQTSSRNYTLDVVPPFARGLILADGGSGTLTNFWRRPTGGDLIPNGWQWSGPGISHVNVHPWGWYAFISNGARIDVHRLKLFSDELEAASGSETLDGNVTSMACTPDGRFFYATTDAGTLWSYSVAVDTGALSALPSGSLTLGNGPCDLVCSPDGHTLYATLEIDGTIAIVDLDPTTGFPGAVGYVNSVVGACDLTISPDGERIYTAGGPSGQLLGYDVTPATGALAPLSWSPASVAPLGEITLSITPDSSRLYVASDAGNAIRMFSLDALTGAPVALSPATVPGLAPVAHLEVEPRGTQVYAALTDGRLLVYDIESNGQLKFAEVGVHLRGTSLADFDFVRGHVPYRLVTENVYATSVSSDAVYEYSFDSTTGTLVDLPGTPFGTGGVDPRTVSVHPYSEHLIVAHGNATGSPALSVHALDGTGLMQAGTAVGAERNNAGLAFDPSGRRAYLASNGTTGPSIVRYNFNATTGALDPVGANTVSGFLWPPAVHPTGRMLAVPDTAGDELEVFSIDPQSGALTYRGNVRTNAIDPFRCVFDASGRFLFTGHIGSPRMAVHSVNLATGMLTPVAGSPFLTTIHPLVMSLSPDGRRMMIADTANATWSCYAVDQDPSNATLDGTLSLVGSGTQSNMALLRFDATSTKLLWVNSGTQELVCSPIDAPGVLGTPLSSAPIGTSITSMDMRNRAR